MQRKGPGKICRREAVSPRRRGPQERLQKQFNKQYQSVNFQKGHGTALA
jgi:hypothetical protein